MRAQYYGLVPKYLSGRLCIMQKIEHKDLYIYIYSCNTYILVESKFLKNGKIERK